MMISFPKAELSRPRSHRQRTRWTLPTFLLVMGGLPTVAPAQETAHQHAPSQPSPDPVPVRVPLLEGLGTLTYPVTNSTPLVQRYFDQGLRLTWAFNHEEAVAAFREAARLDPDCAMCWWGAAFALGPNINAGMEAEAGLAAWEAIQEARQASGASGKERALIHALAARYAPDAPTDRAALDSAWAREMSALAARYPDDPEVNTLYADALMNLRPWAYWTRDRKPQPGTEAMLAALEEVIRIDPNHPGACHLFIHAVEAAYPERAEACADRLGSLMPAAGHLVHMPAHIYIRVGRYADAIEANHHAIHADQGYIRDRGPQGIYPVAYYPHNIHFLSFAALLAGRGELAAEKAADLSEAVDPGIAALVPELQGLLPYNHLVLSTLGRWEEVLELAIPGVESTPFSAGLAHYARGVAMSALGRGRAAGVELQALEAADRMVRHEPAATVLSIARHALTGEIAARAGDNPRAIRELSRAVGLEDTLDYMEPPYWHMPLRPLLAEALLRDGRATQAELLYREDLARFPRNGWSLSGLARALEAQGRIREARETRGELSRSWEGGDVTLPDTRYSW